MNDLIALFTKTGALGISTDDGETVVNPAGRRVPADSAVWTAGDVDADLAKATDAQRATVEAILRADHAAAEARIVEREIAAQRAQWARDDAQRRVEALARWRASPEGIEHERIQHERFMFQMRRLMRVIDSMGGAR